MFKHLEVKDGLPNNQITTIIKDSKGFMWFATASGLARYDGYVFKVFRNERDNPRSLPDNYIDRMVEDADGRLWLHTGVGYTYYDLHTESFADDVMKHLQSFEVMVPPDYVFVDSRKNEWYYTNWNRCYLHRYGTDYSDTLRVEPGVLPTHPLKSMAECKEGILMAFENGAVYCIDRDDMHIRWRLTDIPEELGENNVEVYTLFVDSDEYLWIYSAKGVWVYNLANKKWVYDRNQYVKREGQNMIRAVVQDRHGKIWVGKDQNGIDIVDKRTQEVVSLSYRADADNDRGLQHNTISALYEDQDGVVWVGTHKKGVAYYNESIYKFAINQVGDVNCIEDAGNGSLWLGTNDEGLIYWNPRSGYKQTFKSGGSGTISTNVIVCLLRARNGKLWVGTFFGGLNSFDGNSFRHYRHNPNNPNSLASDNVWSLAEDADGNIWIATLGGGLQCLNPRTGEFTTYNESNSNLVSNYLSSICISKKGFVIIGTASAGIAILDPNNNEITNLTSTRSGNVSLTNQNINQVYEDCRGLIWIATRDGLNLLDLENDRLQRVSSSNHSERYISGITEDNSGNIWVTTAKGVSNIIPTKDLQTGEYTFRFYLYDNKDGLQSSEFNQRAIKRLPSGTIAMGGLYGVNTFAPNDIQYNETQPKVIFTGLQLFGETVEVGKEYDGHVILPGELNSVKEVTLDYAQNIFSVSFATDNYILPDKTRYLYMLEGFNDEWLTADASLHRVTYTNLAPGSYTLKVKAINSDGLVGQQESTLEIVIRPPFWMTPWAYLLYVFFFLSVFMLAFYFMRRREQQKFKIRQIQEEAKKNNELNQMKFRFFTNVSHELRTPLTLIISPLEAMIKEENDKGEAASPSTQNKLNMIHRNAVRLLNLVNQLLDFRKNEMAGMHLSLSEGDMVAYVRNICTSFLMLSEKKNVHLTFFSSVEALTMAFDEDKMGKVVMNLLSNAFKFTPSGGRVDVSLKPLPGEPEMVEIRVADTGIGIKDEDKKHIFERFYQVETEEQSTGSGIGLSLVHDFVKLHEGKVEVVDNVGTGTVFVIQIPVKHSEVLSKSLAQEEDEDEMALAAATEDLAAAKEKEGSGKEKEALSPEERKKPIALVVDDNEDLVSFMKESLSLYFRVHTACNGQEAWMKIPDLMPDIIVSDVMMPEMDGNELCRWVKSDKRTSHIPLILLTAKETVEDKLEGLKIGADDYVNKPFNVEVLILRMRKLIELSAAGRQRTQIDPEPSEIQITSLDEQLVANAIKYVEENISRPELSVEELAQALNMSRVHLYKKLSQITGKTPIEFIRIIRLKRSVQLLKESQLNVSEIAYQVGFNNPKYFAKYFKDEFGVLPSVYQQKEGK